MTERERPTALGEDVRKTTRRGRVHWSADYHPGSFRKMFMEQLIAKTGITRYHLLGRPRLGPTFDMDRSYFLW